SARPSGSALSPISCEEQSADLLASARLRPDEPSPARSRCASGFQASLLATRHPRLERPAAGRSAPRFLRRERRAPGGEVATQGPGAAPHGGVGASGAL